MKVWGDIPGVGGGPRAAVVVEHEACRHALAVRLSSGIYRTILPGHTLNKEIWGEGGTETEREALDQAHFDIGWRDLPAKPKYVPTSRR